MKIFPASFENLNVFNVNWTEQKTLKQNDLPVLRDVEWIIGVVKVAPNLLHI